MGVGVLGKHVAHASAYSSNCMYLRGIFRFFSSYEIQKQSKWTKQNMNGKQDALHAQYASHLYKQILTDAHTTHWVIHYVCILLPHIRFTSIEKFQMVVRTP